MAQNNCFATRIFSRCIVHLGKVTSYFGVPTHTFHGKFAKLHTALPFSENLNVRCCSNWSWILNTQPSQGWPEFMTPPFTSLHFYNILPIYMPSLYECSDAPEPIKFNPYSSSRAWIVINNWISLTLTQSRTLKGSQRALYIGKQVIFLCSLTPGQLWLL